MRATDALLGTPKSPHLGLQIYVGNRRPFGRSDLGVQKDLFRGGSGDPRSEVLARSRRPLKRGPMDPDENIITIRTYNESTMS